MVLANFPQKSGLSIITNTNNPPQGLVKEVIPPTENSWIDDLGNQFVDDLGNVVVFVI